MLAPCSTATSELATAHSRSLWVWMPTATSRASTTALVASAICGGRLEPFVSPSETFSAPGSAAGAIRFAERDVLGPGIGRGAHAFQRVPGVVPVAIEEVLGVVDHALACVGEIRDRVSDHRQVLLAAHLGDLLEVEAPGLADQGHHGREAIGQQPQSFVLGRLGVPAPGHAEGADGGLLEIDFSQHLEELELLRVGPGEAGLDEVDAELVELGDHADLLLRGEGHALALHAVAQSRVVEEYLSHRCLSSWTNGEPLNGAVRNPRAARRQRCR